MRLSAKAPILLLVLHLLLAIGILVRRRSLIAI
jgi:hypothetical protein